MGDKSQNAENLLKCIESFEKNIQLECDIYIKNSIKITQDDLTIDGNGHTIDAQNNSQIFNITGNNITLKNIIFKNALTKKSGGAILNFKGAIKVIDCEFINNTTSQGDGGAICNWNGNMEVNHCEFNNNCSEKDGGAIFNGGEIIISHSDFHNNISKRGLTIFNNSDSILTLKKSNFKRDNSNLENSLTNNEIFNKGMINLESGKTNQKKLIKSGFIHEVSNNFNSFKYLDNLIQDNEKIILDCDIEKINENDYKNGITIDKDGLIIDGNGHTIDALGKSRIFTITAQNVTLKNINFKNGTSDMGGSIKTKSNSLMIINCNFENNLSQDGGAIYNDGIINLYKCNFENNISKKDYGGAIQNNNEIILKECNFKNNISKNYAGAINNSKSLIPRDCTFKSNLAKIGGAINNTDEGITNILKCNFKDNFSISQANSIFNDGYGTIKECNFNNLKYDNNPTIIYHNGTEDSELTIENSIFSQEYLKNNAIYVKNGFCNIISSKFNILQKANYIVHNENAILKIEKLKVNNSNNIIFNNNILKIRKDEFRENEIKLGEKSKEIKYLNELLPENWKGFKFLDELIHGHEKEITINEDIKIHETEQDFYESGIELEMDNITINGNFHTIDADNLSRIFIISGKNIVLKNIRFKNGKYYKNKFDKSDTSGGAIYIMPRSAVEIDSCIFLNNLSRQTQEQYAINQNH